MQNLINHIKFMGKSQNLVPFFLYVSVMSGGIQEMVKSSALWFTYVIYVNYCVEGWDRDKITTFSCMVIRCTCNPALYLQPGATFELNIELLEVVQPEKGGTWPDSRTRFLILHWTRIWAFFRKDEEEHNSWSLVGGVFLGNLEFFIYLLLFAM